MKLLDTTPGVFSEEEAQRVARELGSGDDEWTYHVEPIGGGRYHVFVLDQYGEEIGYVSALFGRKEGRAVTYTL